MAGKKNKLKVIDLFSGVGGMSHGFKKAGFNVISANEYMPEIANTYVKNHPKTKMIVDSIIDVDSKDLLNGEKSVDVIVGGPPCQGFSMAGKRIRKQNKNSDPRNELFKEFLRIVKDLRPKVFVMENVPAILSMQNGDIKNEILSHFKELGYDTKVDILLAADYGVPQMRRRAIFIGNNMGINPEKFFPSKSHGPNRTNPYVTINDSISDLPRISSGGGSFVMDYKSEKKITNYQIMMRKNGVKIYNHQASLHDARVIEMLKGIKQGDGRLSLPANLQTKSVHSGAYGRMNGRKPAYTITTRFDTPSVGRVTHPVQHRAITPREAARLQSFDDAFVFYGSKTSIGIQIGNAVPPLLAQAIALRIKHIFNNKK
ncbi:MAG: DNA cytosine methyltransferase [Patescibacteria group bacterium]